MSDTPKKQPPFTDCPKTEKVFPFKRMDDGHWYRYQSDAIDLCENLERENAALREDKERLDAIIEEFRRRLGFEYARKLERENAALREDNKRLDWLEKNCSYLPIKDSMTDGLSLLFIAASRAAIDAARKEQP